MLSQILPLDGSSIGRVIFLSILFTAVSWNLKQILKKVLGPSSTVVKSTMMQLTILPYLPCARCSLLCPWQSLQSSRHPQWGKCAYCHFTDVETEVQGGTANKQQGQGRNPGSPAPDFLHLTTKFYYLSSYPPCCLGCGQRAQPFYRKQSGRNSTPKSKNHQK